MPELLKSVRYGILIGFLGLLLGMGWAVWLVVGHDQIHKTLEQGMGEESREHGGGHVAQAHEHTPEHVHQESQSNDSQPDTAGVHFEGGHDDPVMELAHTRLRWAHVHFMGLGLLTIVLSLVLALTSVSAEIKGAISVLAGLGGWIYPSAWIVMGYRTPSLGPEGSEASVAAIAGPGIILVFLGIVTTAFFLLKSIFSGSK